MHRLLIVDRRYSATVGQLNIQNMIKQMLLESGINLKPRKQLLETDVLNIYF